MSNRKWTAAEDRAVDRAIRDQRPLQEIVLAAGGRSLDTIINRLSYRRKCGEKVTVLPSWYGRVRRLAPNKHYEYENQQNPYQIPDDDPLLKRLIQAHEKP